MTVLFPPVAGPRVFGLSPGIDFSRTLISGLEARLAGAPPEAMAQVEIWVNTQRARRSLMDLFATGPARLLPRIRVVTGLADDPRAPIDLPAPVPDLRRKLELSRLVARLLAIEPGFAAETAAFDLADSLADLMDEMQGEGVAPAAIAKLDPAEHAAHWQRSLRLLDILRDYIDAGGVTDGQGRLRHAATAWATMWSDAPPAHPVIVAGSTGSRGATRVFMAAVARLPQGALVLPGFDAQMPAHVWARLGADEPGAADHPQYGFARLADALGFEPTDVPPWHEAQPPNRGRNALVSLALRPAPVTDQWRAEGAALAPDLIAAMEDVTWVEAESTRAEARAIAFALCGAAASGTRAALVTPDRLLVRRVTAELSRWGLIPDDSAGRPLALTPPGVLLRRTAALIGTDLTPDALLVLLKHPLINSGADARRPHLALTARLEMGRLRGGAPLVDWCDLADWAAAEGGAAPAWLAWLKDCLAPLSLGVPRPLAELVALHRRATEELAAGPDAASHTLWDMEAGAQSLAMITALATEADALGTIAPTPYRALIRSLMAARDVPEEAVVTHPDLAIWGTLEARVQSADLVILGGLNEGVWPRLPGADPWLSRAMRARLGLPSPERRIGLSAHDFQQACGAGRVILTRATRDAEAPSVAARWLLRLENLLLGLGDPGQTALRNAREQGAMLLAQASQLDRPAAATPPARRPAPRPPTAARPAQLSVTQVETLIRDPYAIYARKVLGLRALDPPGRVADALARGTALHATLDAYVTAREAAPDVDERELFADVMEKTLARTVPWPAVRMIWAARLARSSSWFLDGEAERRTRALPYVREARGARPMHGLPFPFSVTARADRIDRTDAGDYAIYDYKSGTPPTEKEAKAFRLQLWLEAAIAEAGGFEGVPVAPTVHLEFIGLGAQKSLVLDPDRDAVRDIWARLVKLVRVYQDPATGFAARLRPHRLMYSSDYDHLSRFGEWDDGDAADLGGAS